MYGEVAAEMFQGVADIEGAAYYDNALRLRDMGRLLLATEVRQIERKHIEINVIQLLPVKLVLAMILFETCSEVSSFPAT